MDKLYLIVRQDLLPCQQAVQAAHAMRQWSEDHPAEDRAWFQDSNTLALLGVPTGLELGVILEQALLRGFPVAAFREPDLGNELTALALGPQGKCLTKRLQLALQWPSSSSSRSRSSSA